MLVSQKNVTLAMAAKFLEMRWENQRPIRNSHVSFLAEEMRRKRFDTSVVELAIVNSEDRTVLIDGQHTLKAIELSGLPQVLIIKTIMVEDSTELARKFGRIDVQRRRSLADSLRAFGIQDRTGFTSTEAHKIIASVYFIRSGFGLKNIKRKAHEDSVGMIENWQSEGDRFFDIYRSLEGTKLDKQRFLNRAFMSVSLALLRYTDPRYSTKVNEFIRGFIHGVNLGKNNPILVGRNRYLSTETHAGAYGGRSRELWSVNGIARLVAWSWNCYAEGLSRSRVGIPKKNGTAPLKLTGCKYIAGIHEKPKS